MTTKRTPHNAASEKRPVIKAGTTLYGVAKRNQSARIIVHSDQPQKNGSLYGDTIVGNIEILALGSAINNYPKLQRYFTSREIVSVEACDEMILSQEAYSKKDSKLHHLFRYNGWTTKEYLTHDQRLSVKVNEEEDEEKLENRIRKAEESSEIMNISPGEVAQSNHLHAPTSNFPEGDPTDNYESEEGRKILVTHFQRERDPRLVREAKEWYMSKDENNEAPCEACGEKQLTLYGINILEAHHIDPIGKREGSSITTKYDFNHLCPSCHRALHRMGKGATVERFKEWLSDRGVKIWISK